VLGLLAIGVVWAGDGIPNLVGTWESQLAIDHQGTVESHQGTIESPNETRGVDTEAGLKAVAGLGPSAPTAGAAGHVATQEPPTALTQAPPDEESAEPEVTSPAMVVAAETVEVHATLKVHATRADERSDQVPASIAVVTGRQIELDHPVSSLPDALEGLPGVMVQKTARGFGSPYIRGFTGFRTLTLFDGVRINNATWREGPNQYLGGFDSYGLEQVEVLRGPGSVSRGSDAIGGTIQIVPNTPAYRPGGGAGVTLASRAGTADAGVAGHLGAHLGGERWGASIGATYRDLGDLRGGSEVGNNPATGYAERGLRAVAAFRLGNNDSLKVSGFDFQQFDVPRVHRTVHRRAWEGIPHGSMAPGSGDDLVHEFDMGHALVYARWEHLPNEPWLRNLRVTVSRQEVTEDRRRVKLSKAWDLTGLAVSSWGIDVQATSTLGRAELVWGIEAQRDAVDSYRTSFNAAGTITGRGIQGPVADDATYNSQGAYGQATVVVAAAGRLVLGARFSRHAADARRVEDPATGTPFAITGEWHSATGEIRYLQPLGDSGTSAYAAVAQGFRAPNLSDLTTLDLTERGYFEVPSPALTAETFITYEAGIKGAGQGWSLQGAVFSTHIADMIDRYPSGTRTPDGDLIIYKANVSDGRIFGWEAETQLRLARNVSGAAWAFQTRGDATTYVNSSNQGAAVLVLAERPVSRIPPLMGGASVRYRPEGGHWWVEAEVVAAARQDRLAPKDELDSTRIPPGGTPGYVVGHLRGGFRISAQLEATASLLNVTNEDYRIHGSGINEPGFGAVLGLLLKLR
jgi:hemoglobin/transferrin/lactoferrin receptor protein